MGLLGLQQENHYFMAEAELHPHQLCSFIHLPVSCSLHGNPVSVLGLVRPNEVMGLV